MSLQVGDLIPLLGSGSINVFTQMDEPKIKKGIWMQTENSFKNVVIDDKYFFANEWEVHSKPAPIPYAYPESGGIVNVEDYIYLFGYTHSASNYMVRLYRYDTLSNTYTRLTDIPFSFSGGITVAIDTNVYVFGGGNGVTTSYLYNTVTDTYKKLANIPVNISQGKAVAIGDTIYSFGHYASYNGEHSIAYKRNTQDNTYTAINDIPFSFRLGSIANVGSEIYLFGGYVNNKTAYKYNIESNEYVRLSDIPHTHHRADAVSIGTDIYLFGAESGTGVSYTYKYDTVSDTYTRLPDMEYSNFRGTAIPLHNKIYVFPSSATSSQPSIFLLTAKEYLENTLVVDRNSNRYGLYYTELISSDDFNPVGNFPFVETGFNDVFLYYNNDLHRPPAYYGDGEKWIQFR